MEKLEINILPKFIDEAATPVAKTVGNSIACIWNLAFGNHVSYWLKKQEFKHQKNYEDFVQKVNSKTENISPANLKDPEIHIIGPAIEASKYYIDSEALREMFANLISASVDSSKTDILHPSFVEIVKQLSPLDAMNIDLFKLNNQMPIANYIYKKVDGSFLQLDRNIFLENKSIDNLSLTATSISNLERLGIVNITYDTYLQQEYYKKFYETKLYLNHQRTLEDIRRSFDGSVTSTNYPQHYSDIERLDIKKGMFSITPYGMNFMEICLA